MDIAQQELVFTASALLCAGVCSIPDVRERRIPNIFSGPAMVAGLLLHTALGGWFGLGDSMFAGLASCALSLIFYIAGGMGAGDVKLMGAIGCLAGFAPLRMMLISIAIAGALLAVAISAFHGRLRETLRNVIVLLVHHRSRGLQRHPDLNLDDPHALCMPFAVPVAAGCLFTFCSLVLERHS